MKHNIVHFEIPADDVERGKAFYAQLFGWQFSGPPGFPEYWTVEMAEGEAGPGLAMMARQAPGQVPTSYFDVESVADYLVRVEQLGGKVLMPKTPVPGMGWFAVCQDTEGNMFGLWQADPAAA